MTRLALSDNFTKYKTSILCLYKTVPSFVHKNIWLLAQTYTKNKDVIMKLWVYF